MTLDPVHVDGIADLAGRVEQHVDERDQTALAERAWTEFLDPLYADGEVVLEPLGEHRRRKASLPEIGLAERPFPGHHGLDAGTINPTTFKNGLVLDVSQAAMASVPSDVELHRERTIVMTVHTNDETVDVGEDWREGDRGYARRRILQAPRVDRYEQTVVHALALYRAESEHALDNADDVEELLVLDGPLYPTGLLKWVERDPELKRLVIEEAEFTGVVENYLELVERFVERDVPLVGFVKNSASKALTRELRRKAGAPWVDDEAFFRRVLERRENGDLRTDALSFSCWFRSRVGTDGLLAGGELDPGLDARRGLDADAYEVTFFVVYDPRDDLVYRVEAPHAVTREQDRREQLTAFALAEIASERGPPTAVQKADELARIDRQGKQTLRRRIEREFDTSQQRSYDDRRWGATERANVE
jgi:hypothetical protein